MNYLMHPVTATEQNLDDLPEVLLIGDSTAIRYYPRVRDQLKNKANVYRIVELSPQRLHSLVSGGPLTQQFNTTSTTATLSEIRTWTVAHPWTVVHANWGLHDTDALSNRPLIEICEQYQIRLDALITELLDHSTAHVVISTTTPVADSALEEQIRCFNNVVKGFSNHDRISVNDVREIEHLDTHLESDGIHFDQQGSEEIGRTVSNAIEAALLKKKAMGSRSTQKTSEIRTLQ